MEDQGGMRTADEVRAKFGDRVAGIVLACTDSLAEDPAQKAPWEERKRHHIAKLAAVDADVALVTAADKLHNLTALIRDVSRDGPRTLERFNAPNRLVWYFTAVAEALAAHEDIAPVAEIRMAAAALNALCQSAD